MKTRILSGMVGAAMLVGLLIGGKRVLGSAVFVAALLGMNEYCDSMRMAGHRPIKPISFICCLPLLLMTFG